MTIPVSSCASPANTRQRSKTANTAFPTRWTRFFCGLWCFCWAARVVSDCIGDREPKSVPSEATEKFRWWWWWWTSFAHCAVLRKTPSSEDCREICGNSRSSDSSIIKPVYSEPVPMWLISWFNMTRFQNSFKDLGSLLRINEMKRRIAARMSIADNNTAKIRTRYPCRPCVDPTQNVRQLPRVDKRTNLDT